MTQKSFSALSRNLGVISWVAGILLKDLIFSCNININMKYILLLIIYLPIWQPRFGGMAPFSGIAPIYWEIVDVEGGAQIIDFLKSRPFLRGPHMTCRVVFDQSRDITQ